MPPGPLPQAAAGTRGGQQRRRRLVGRAQANVLRILADLLRLEVLPLRSVTEASDVARLALLARALRREKLAEPTVVGVLILDWAARAPELTADFMASLRGTGACLRKLPPRQVLARYTKISARQEWKTFWHGPTQLNMVAFLRAVSPEALLEIGKRLAVVDRVRGSALLPHMQALPHMGPYLAMSLLRAVAAGSGQNT